MLEDLRLAVRRLRRSPGFTAAGVLVLAVGIGGSTAVFSVLRSVVLRQLAVPAPEQLVRLYEIPAGLDQHWPFPAPDYFDLGKESSAFQSVTAIRPDLQTLSSPGTPVQIRVARVTSTFFDTLKVWPVRGGVPDASQDLSGGPRTAVVTDGFWRRELGGDPAALGRTIVLDGRTYTVGGVMAPDFRFPLLRDAEVLLPAAFEPFERNYQAWLDVFARLKPGVSVRAAQADLDVVAPRIFDRGERFGQRVSRSEGRAWQMQVRPLLEDLVGPVKPALTALLGAVLLTLLIACANVASLLLARGMSRQRELAIRAALGGGRSRLVRHLMIDALVVALLGGALAVVLAPWALSALLTLAPHDLPRLAEVRVDGVVLAFAVLAAVITGVLAGLVPALQLTRPQLMDVLRNGSGGTENPARARAFLVVAEIALAFVLAAGAGLMVRTLRALLDVDTGLAGSERVLVANLSLPSVRYPDDRIVGVVRELLQSESASPGVRSAALTTSIPLEPNGRAEFGFSLEGESFPPALSPKAEVVFATPGYLATLGIPLVAGRDLAMTDDKRAPKVALVNQAFARRFTPSASPIGRRISDLVGPQINRWEIVGVIGDVRTKGLDMIPGPLIVIPLLQFPIDNLRVALRAAQGDPMALLAPLRQQVLAIDKDLPLSKPRVVTAVVSESLGDRRFQMILLSVFAVTALALAAIGIYGVIAYAVAQRSREIGIRMALGADKGVVRRMVLRGGMKLAGLGIAIGLAGAFALTRALSAFIYNVGTMDPLTMVCAAAVLLGSAALASWVPALRATRVDPAVSLRAE